MNGVMGQGDGFIKQLGGFGSFFVLAHATRPDQYLHYRRGEGCVSNKDGDLV